MANNIKEALEQIYELISWSDNVPKELIDELATRVAQYEVVIDKATEMLGEYKHYSSPSEEQNRENEIIVIKTYELLRRKENESIRKNKNI